MVNTRLDKMHELSGKLSMAARSAVEGSVLNLGENMERLDSIRKQYDKEVIRLANDVEGQT